MSDANRYVKIVGWQKPIAVLWAVVQAFSTVVVMVKMNSVSLRNSLRSLRKLSGFTGRTTRLCRQPRKAGITPIGY
jgi:hypothetical protein